MMEVETAPIDTGGGVGNGQALDAFLQTGRTGRRNAIPDILSQDVKDTVSTADLPLSLEKLSCSDSPNSQGGNPNQSQASTSSSGNQSQCAPRTAHHGQQSARVFRPPYHIPSTLCTRRFSLVKKFRTIDTMTTGTWKLSWSLQQPF